MRILHRHLRELGYCNRGARAFCLRHGISWPAFLRTGIDAPTLQATGDAMAQRLIDHAQQETIRGR